MLFNYVLDPNHRYRFSVSGPTLTELSNSEGLFLILPANYDDRALLKKFIQISRPPDIAILGGSRILNIQSEMFRAPYCEKVLNAGVTAGTLNDYVAIWQIMKQRKSRSTMLFLAIEEQGLHGLSQNNRYLSVYQDYNAFFQKGSSLRQHVLGVTTNLKDLLSLETTKASLVQTLRVHERTGFLVSRDKRDAELPARTRSFSMLYPVSNETRPVEKVNEMGRENGFGELKIFEKWNRSEGKGLQDLRLLLRDIKNSGSKLILISMPYHPEAYKIITQSRQARENLEYFVSGLRKLSETEGIFFYDAIMEHGADFKREDFLDGVHLKMAANHRLLRDADDGAGWHVVSEKWP